MPHKHTRKGLADKSTVDLPPTQVAKPLPVSKSAAPYKISKSSIDEGRRCHKKRKRDRDQEDDTPKAFVRIMAFQQGKRLPKSLDDGVRSKKAEKKGKKRKLTDESQRGIESHTQAVTDTDILTIRPGERMSEFAGRVDAALPVRGLMHRTGKGGKNQMSIKFSRTKMEKRMHRMYDEWRATEARLKEQHDEAAEQAEEEALDLEWATDVVPPRMNRRKGRRQIMNGKTKIPGGIDDDETDPWARITRDRGEEKAHWNDVVDAPPSFSHISKAKFGGGDVPKKSGTGSLRRREELREIRTSVVEGYRAMMKRNQAQFE